tara:strand:- start:18 stop:416 length:399 start_codon:yes stop_codon:yes gene_type:complete
MHLLAQTITRKEFSAFPRIDRLCECADFCEWMERTIERKPKLNQSNENRNRKSLNHFWRKFGGCSLANEADEVTLAVFLCEPDLLPELQENFFRFYLDEDGETINGRYSRKDIRRIESKLVERALYHFNRNS